MGMRAFKKYSLHTFWDVLSLLPSRYDTYVSGTLSPLVGQKVALALHYEKCLSKSPWRFLFYTATGEKIVIIFFHYPKKIFTPGSDWEVRGQLACQNQIYQLVHPSFFRPLKKNPPAYQLIAHYPVTISSEKISENIHQILEKWPQKCANWGKSDLFPSLKESLARIHFPQRNEDIEPKNLWRQRLAYDELLAQQFALMSLNQENRTVLPLTVISPLFSHPYIPLEETEFLQHFGHALTPSQEQAWHDIKQDFLTNFPMKRFIHGDVGSGKTVIAFLALIYMAALGQQGCLMAPTEMLAQQHFENLCRWLPKNISARLILGGKKSSQDALITIGTHALLYEKAEFSNLSLVVIDEQHRFGVMQRMTLIDKGISPHLLFLSATPIPRTFEMLLSGHIKISRIERRTALSVKNYVMPGHRFPQLKSWIAHTLKKGENVYWVCPVIDDDIKGLYTRYHYWQEHFSDQVACLHGRMPCEEKAQSVQNFRQGKTPFLISTTVIEVGIHVPQASCMIIENSQNFGLSQLHQLRGRIGREDIPGHCIFLHTPPLTSIAKKRLRYIKSHTNGFDIAECDWNLRGGGKLLHTDQSGFASYKFLDFSIHAFLIEKAIRGAQCPCPHKELLLNMFSYKPAAILKAG